MIGRKVQSRWFAMTGEVVKWEPLVNGGGCDILIREETGKESYGFHPGRLCWYGSENLEPIDGLGPLPRRDVMREWARLIMIDDLRGALDQHVKDFYKPWPGCEFGKAIIGNAIVGALKDLESKG